MDDEAMKAMVDRIREEHWPDFDNAALAAIIETREDSDREQVRSGVETLCATFVAKAQQVQP